jgi:5-aminopentanamidase
MRVAAYQAPYLPFGSLDAVGLIAGQLASCEARGVDVLCCPESVIGGLAHESDGQSPAEVSLRVDTGELARTVRPLLDTPVTVIVGFTERDRSGCLFSSAAVLTDSTVAAVYRKVYPGYRTAISAGDRLPGFRKGRTRYGVIICNDMWYLEPARVLAAAGAAVLFVPTHGGHLRQRSDSFRERGRNLPVARAVDNSITVVVADVAGRQQGRLSYGFSAIIDPDGAALARAEPWQEALLVADAEPARRRQRDPRGWDGATNPAVTREFLQLWRTPGDDARRPPPARD